jgi:spoIIIJ-associated protein
VGGKKYTIAGVGQRIEQFLRPIIKGLRLRVDFQIEESPAPHPDLVNPDLIVKFHGPDTEVILANKGELLLSLEQLTMEVLRMPGEDHNLLCFDANDHRMLRIEELRLSALTAAEKVKKTRVPFRFNPMSSRERRIIHVALRDESDVRSESAGEGPFRQVVIYPAGMPSAPAGAAPNPGFRRRRR